MNITVTKPYLPPKEKYSAYVDQIWDRNWLTNGGPLVNKLELRLKEYLNLNHLLYVTNGTIAIQIAIKALELKGEVLTTPFTYVATTSSAVWEGLKPVFVDIDATTYNIDATKIVEKITPNTTAILATHVFGNPCDIDAIESIAKKYNLKVIYDAAHCFGVKYKGRSIFEYGDISTASFHATKVFHTVEGGALISNNKELIVKMVSMRNFGHNGYEDFSGIGINGKNSEFHAAMGLAVLDDISEVLLERKNQHLKYQKLLETHSGSFQNIKTPNEYNYSYFSLLFEDEKSLIKSEKALRDHNITPRRYFYPPMNKLSYVENQECPVAESIASHILCLPLYHNLTEEEQVMVCRLLLRIQNN